MTPEWITKAAAEAYRGPRMHVGTVTDREVQAFIAGVELGLAKAAEVADSQPVVEMALAGVMAGHDVATAIRALGSDENEEE